jgi:hypothetical protein
MKRQYRGRFLYIHSCPSSTSEDIGALVDAERDISLRTFREAVGLQQWRELQQMLGYDRYFPISRDWHVGYYRSVYRGVPAVFVRWSAMEYIFTLDGVLGPSLAK